MSHDLAELFDRIPVALYRSAPDGHLLTANPALASLLGFASVEEAQQHLRSVESVYVDPSERARWIEAVSHAGVIQDFDVELKKADGSTIWVRDSARAIKDERGRLLFFEGSLLDVTDKVQAQRDKDEFIAAISHELRNPIAVVVGLGEELAKNYETFTDIDRQELASLIALQAEDAGWLIEDLLVAYREDINKVAIAPATFDIVKQVERILEVIDRPVEVRVYDGSTDVYADPRRTRQILRNLMSNAISYGGDDVAVQIAKSGDRIEVAVKDSGLQIETFEIERLFKSFERGSGHRNSKSVGLGLSVSRRLARLMDGDLVYRYDDDWSTFVLSLPAA